MADRKVSRQAARLSAENSFASVAGLWLAHWRQDKTPPDTLTRCTVRMAADILPVLGDRPMAEIQAPELVQMVKRIEERGASDLAKRSLETTNQIFRFAIAHSHASRNPASEIKPRDVLRANQEDQPSPGSRARICQHC